MLPPAQRGSKEELIAKVEQKISPPGSRTTRPDTWKRRAKISDEAVDWMLESGYDLDADAKTQRTFSIA